MTQPSYDHLSIDEEIAMLMKHHVRVTCKYREGIRYTVKFPSLQGHIRCVRREFLPALMRPRIEAYRAARMRRYILQS